jgi:hypothetical protein
MSNSYSPCLSAFKQLFLHFYGVNILSRPPYTVRPNSRDTELVHNKSIIHIHIPVRKKYSSFIAYFINYKETKITGTGSSRITPGLSLACFKYQSVSRE